MHASEVRVLAQNCLLAAGYGAAMMSSLVEVSGHPNVWRARIDDGTRALGSQVIVKRGGDTLDGVAALTVLAGESIAPRLLAHNSEHELVVLEDLGGWRALADRLMGTDPLGGREALLRFADLLARLHGISAGRLETLSRVRAGLGPVTTDFPTYTPTMARECELLTETCSVLGLEISEGVRRDLRDVVEALEVVGPFHGLVHGDPCPDNVLITDDGMRLIDFDWSGARHTFLDAVYLTIPFASCWCVGRFPARLGDELMDAYLWRLCEYVPAAADAAQVRGNLSSAYAGWFLIHLNHWWRWADEVPDASLWHDLGTRRQRVRQYLVHEAIALQALQTHGALASLAQSAAKVVTQRWSALPPLDLYPAFRQTT